MKLKKVLIIEDNEELGVDVVKEFEANHVEVNHMKNYDEFEEKINDLPDHQMVILDWLLDGGSSDLAKLCLIKIQETCFMPVIVWTEEIEVFQGEADEVYNIFPKACIHGFSKSKVSYPGLIEVLQDWHSKPPMVFSEHFRKSISSAVEKALYTLAKHSIDDLVRGLKTLIATGLDSTEVDIEHAVDVLVRLIGREVYYDDEFIPELRQIIENLKLQKPPADKKERNIVSSIQNLHMYYKPREDDMIVRTGDVVNVEFNINRNNLRAIVITPACDLAHTRRTMFLRLATIHEAITRNEREGRKLDKWPFVEDGKEQVVSHHEILVVINETLVSDENIKSVMSYEHVYKTLCGVTVKIRREKRLDEPYRADLLHHFISHAGRIGKPDFTAPAE